LASRIRVVHLGGTFVNSLGMRFAPVPRTTVLFSIWDTRVEDYRLYAEANPGGDSNWKNPGFAREIDCPVVMVSWIEAKAFCAWLTQKERKEGRITQHQEYRLPTDKEWSAAVGNRKYPWGDQWPPPAGDAPILNGGSPSPVGSYSPNEYGLYDMGGNVWQWCEDWYQSGLNEQALLDKYPYLKDDGGGKTYRVDRGPALGATDPAMLSTSYRNRDPFGDHLINHGFRCVLAPVEAAPGSSATK
ncbi:MAG TPA: formylglycine-generating enzyme family protein, partial [Verrucomicrobiae bacterium]|nr:formylglycine-generating enzyme family protein [Verrucomicrobiae bacterium]